MNCLVFRFSAMGDVALTVPVLRSVLLEHPDVHITLVSNAAYEPFFYNLPRFKFYGVNLKQYKGFWGLRRLFNELNNYQKWECVLDLHSVMRTWILDRFFGWIGTPVYKIDKGRKEKKALTRKDGKELKQLPHTCQRYMNVFELAGLGSKLNLGNAIHPASPELPSLPFDTNKPWIGIAPFSKHVQKEWPLENIKFLINNLAAESKFEILLFGGGEKERQLLENVAQPHINVHSVAGKFSLVDEIVLVSKLKLMISMDSFNMHLAALIGVNVISIWGATHSFAGFGPVNNNEKYKVEVPVEELTCRPCSVFGSKPCYRGDLACMSQISNQMVQKKISLVLKDSIK